MWVRVVAIVIVVVGMAVAVRHGGDRSMEKGRAMFSNRPRVRKEWRTLSAEERTNVANAFWTLKNVSTAEGRSMYGKHFNSYGDLVMLHACAVLDIRCDQGHASPAFMMFHRAFLRKVELSLLAVDPSISGLPYWNMAWDAEGGRYDGDSVMGIFTDSFFGNYTGLPGNNFAISNGLFADFPVDVYTEERFGPESPLAAVSECIAQGYFQPQPSSVCDRCCGDQSGTCQCSSEDHYTRYLRRHDDCTPYVARDVFGQTPLGGSYKIQYSEETFDVCTRSTENTPYWMTWHNCIDPGSVNCLGAGGSEEEQTAAVVANLLGAGAGERAPRGVDSDNCTQDIYSFYDTEGGRQWISSLHIQPHARLGKDMLDLTTSPNDAGPFTGHHANIDRSNMHWMLDVFLSDPEKVEDHWTYPNRQTIQYAGQAPYGISGPFSAYNLLVCGNRFANHYSEFGPSVWLRGTLYDDVVNGGFPFEDLFNCTTSSAGKIECFSDGPYTGADILYWTSPERTPYTYDTLAHFYYDEATFW